MLKKCGKISHITVQCKKMFCRRRVYFVLKYFRLHGVFELWYTHMYIYWFCQFVQMVNQHRASLHIKQF